ncbi:hypothetical protein TWF730_009796 [Orbilia blumenaviensis]|uniref:Uncharacterized protein n=1 Tax=Orbilia blumenaviensis TaxID=1796055 RepID=A0AAV9USS4_9PEZI
MMATQDFDLHFAGDLAKAIFDEVPGEIVKSENINSLINEYLAKPPSAGLDPSISVDERLQKIIQRYLENLKLELPNLLEEVLDEEFFDIVEIPEEQGQEVDIKPSIGTSNEFNLELQAAQHDSTDPENFLVSDSGPNTPLSPSGDPEVAAPTTLPISIKPKEPAAYTNIQNTENPRDNSGTTSSQDGNTVPLPAEDVSETSCTSEESEPISEAADPQPNPTDDTLELPSQSGFENGLNNKPSQSIDPSLDTLPEGAKQSSNQDQDCGPNSATESLQIQHTRPIDPPATETPVPKLDPEPQEVPELSENSTQSPEDTTSEEAIDSTDKDSNPTPKSADTNDRTGPSHSVEDDSREQTASIHLEGTKVSNSTRGAASLEAPAASLCKNTPIHTSLPKAGSSIIDSKDGISNIDIGPLSPRDTDTRKQKLEDGESSSQLETADNEVTTTGDVSTGTIHDAANDPAKIEQSPQDVMNDATSPKKHEKPQVTTPPEKQFLESTIDDTKSTEPLVDLQEKYLLPNPEGDAIHGNEIKESPTLENRLNEQCRDVVHETPQDVQNPALPDEESLFSPEGEGNVPVLQPKPQSIGTKLVQSNPCDGPMTEDNTALVKNLPTITPTATITNTPLETSDLRNGHSVPPTGARENKENNSTPSLDTQTATPSLDIKTEPVQSTQKTMDLEPEDNPSDLEPEINPSNPEPETNLSDQKSNINLINLESKSKINPPSLGPKINLFVENKSLPPSQEEVTELHVPCPDTDTAGNDNHRVNESLVSAGPQREPNSKTTGQVPVQPQKTTPEKPEKSVQWSPLSTSGPVSQELEESLDTGRPSPEDRKESAHETRSIGDPSVNVPESSLDKMIEVNSDENETPNQSALESNTGHPKSKDPPPVQAPISPTETKENSPASPISTNDHLDVVDLEKDKPFPTVVGPVENIPSRNEVTLSQLLTTKASSSQPAISGSDNSNSAPSNKCLESTPVKNIPPNNELTTSRPLKANPLGLQVEIPETPSPDTLPENRSFEDTLVEGNNSKFDPTLVEEEEEGGGEGGEDRDEEEEKDDDGEEVTTSPLQLGSNTSVVLDTTDSPHSTPNTGTPTLENNMLPVTPENLKKLPQEEFKSTPSSESSTHASTPEMDFDEQVTGSPFSQSSTESEDDYVDFKPNPNPQFSRDQTIITALPTGLGLLTQTKPTETVAQQPLSPSTHTFEKKLVEPIIFPESLQLSAPFYENPGLPSSKYNDASSVASSLEEQVLLVPAQSLENSGPTPSPGYEKPANDPKEYSVGNDSSVASNHDFSVETVVQQDQEGTGPVPELKVREHSPLSKPKTQIVEVSTPKSSAMLRSLDIIPLSSKALGSEQTEISLIETSSTVHTASQAQKEEPNRSLPTSQIPQPPVPNNLLNKILPIAVLPRWSLTIPAMSIFLPNIPSVHLPWTMPGPLTWDLNQKLEDTLDIKEGSHIIPDGGSVQGQVSSSVDAKQFSKDEGASLQDTTFIPPLIPGGFPQMEDIPSILETTTSKELCLGLDIPPNTLPLESVWDDIWSQIIFFLNVILLEAWVPGFEFISYLIFTFEAVINDNTGFPKLKTIILDSWTPGLVLLDCIVSLPHLLPEDTVPESIQLGQISIEFWVPILEIIKYLFALPGCLKPLDLYVVYPSHPNSPLSFGRLFVPFQLQHGGKYTANH